MLDQKLGITSKILVRESKNLKISKEFESINTSKSFRKQYSSQA